MIPSVLAAQVRRGVEEFLLTTFPITNPFFAGRLEELLRTDGSLFKGPYLSIKLPFLSGDPSKTLLPGIVPDGFVPHRHQERSWQRLRADTARSTIVATGTGSGKTECFLYPILDYCHRHRGERGIKAIIVYPMNALATDQARRLAGAIHANPQLRGFVSAGLYVGGLEQGDEGTSSTRVMTEASLITDRDTLRQAPPDILLTNYKMLDYLMIRPADLALWRNNGPETLKYFIVDELHTFDGAQGADLACLIRRIKHRVSAPTGHLCCVGTSATLGERAEAALESGTEGMTPYLVNYARRVFGEVFDDDSVVGESLQTPDEFLKGQLVTRFSVPGPEHREALDPLSYATVDDYLRAQYRLWFGTELDTGNPSWRLAVSSELKGHAFFRNLLVVLGARALDVAALLHEIVKQVPGFGHTDREYLRWLLDSFLALVSQARVEQGGRDGPLVQVRYQLWLRELRRMVGLLGHEPSLAFADDLKPEQLERSLPLIHCRECGLMGWGGTVKDADTRVNSDLNTFYRAFFQESAQVRYLFPGMDFLPSNGQTAFRTFLCTSCRRLTWSEQATPCAHCGAELDRVLQVGVPDMTRRVERKDGSAVTKASRDCPACAGANSLTILGSRAASLTSVILAQVFTSPFNDDKKLLAFSDSVQDASHRAGFFSARTFQFTFRAALQRVVEHASSPLGLEELSARFLEYWERHLTEATFIATFLPPDMDWLQDYDHLRREGSLPRGSRLKEDLRRRIGWEIWSEYTFDARIGRTLEKTGSSTLRARPARINAAVRSLLPTLQNEIGGLRTLDAETLRTFVAGIVMSLKNKGGVYHADLERYLESRGNAFLIGKPAGPIYMPAFGSWSRAPVFLTTHLDVRSRFNTLVRAAKSTTTTWYEDWLMRCFGSIDANVAGFASEIYELVVKGLSETGVFFERSARNGSRVWGLDAGLFETARDVQQLRCRRCSFSLSVAAEEVLLFEDTPCPRYRCEGRMHVMPLVDDYYRRLYASGDVQRIFAEEHTGLLTRSAREDVERGFIQHDRPGDANLLSCTPTLEMGINIGDLSSLVLCSVPPKPSNYLQRAGRAGRRDGNAFVLTVAGGRPHDLFFYFEPDEMIQGAVEPPGCFLDASAVLERQFTGYLFDRWVESGLGPQALPSKMGPVLDAIDKAERKPDAFPENLLTFFDLQRTTLEDGFLSLFEDDIEAYSRDRILAFSRGGIQDIKPLPYRIREGLSEVAAERKSLRNRVRQMTTKIGEMERATVRDLQHETTLDQLKQEKAALNALVRSMNDRLVLNFFTDEGLLPNYAFPEAGVVLRSVIYRKNADATEAEQRYPTRSFEYQRPAATAITELAPANSFYVDGRQLLIDQVNLDLSSVEPWRFCGVCSYMEREGEREPRRSCPKCASELWGDEGQRREMLRMRQVISTMSESESRSYDETEDREPEFYQRNMFVVKDDHDIAEAFFIDRDEVPFGFEFFRKVMLREVNFGRAGGGDGTLQIAGRELDNTAFIVCRGCGKVRGAREGHGHDHAPYCRYRGQADKEKVFQACYLYREFSSEAIRMLLPVVSLNTDRAVESFVAALDLGLRKRFRGDPGHLMTTVYEEPLEGSDVRKKFLLLYDGVPGGTGYLKELMQRPEALMEVFELAYKVMESCPCQRDSEKDGCYRCVLAHRGRHHTKNTSRQAAMDLLGRILQNREHLKRTDRIDSIRMNSLLESELEGRFVEALRRAVASGGDSAMSHQVVNGKQGWYLKLPGGNYLIEPQVELGARDGVVVQSRADFVFRPERSGDGLPIAVFTDGYEFHADPHSPNQRLGLDTAQRLAIMRSGRYRVWSVAWDDVQEQFKSNADAVDPPFLVRWDHWRKVLAKVDPTGLQAWAKLREASSFDLLLQLLGEGRHLNWEQYARAFLVHLLQKDGGCDRTRIDEIREGLHALPMGEWPPVPGTSEKSPWSFGALAWRGGDGEMIRGAAYGETSQVQELLRYGAIQGVAGTFRLFDDAAVFDPASFKRSWREFLRLMNVLQFAPAIECVTTRGLEQGRYGQLLDDLFKPPPTGGDDQRGALLDLLAMTSTLVHPLLHQIDGLGLPLPTAGYELANEGGEIVGTAELAWESLRLAVLLPDEAQTGDAFSAQGWTTFQADDLADGAAPLVSALSMGGQR